VLGTAEPVLVVGGTAAPPVVAGTAAGAADGATPGDAGGTPPGAVGGGVSVFSSTLDPASTAGLPALMDPIAMVRVLAKKTAAAMAVERDKKLALPVAPNKLPEAPLPNEAPMSAPLPCCTSTKPITAKAEISWTPSAKFIHTLFIMIERS
jgi:hypothetical protein